MYLTHMNIYFPFFSWMKSIYVNQMEIMPCCSVSLPHLIKDIMLGCSPHHLGDKVNHGLFVSMTIRFIQEFGPPLLDPERIHSQEQEQTVQICGPRENIFNTVKYFEVLRRKHIYKYNDTSEITYWGCHGKTKFTIYMN